MRFNPSISIILGIIVTALLFGILILVFYGSLITLVSVIIGGFVATYFSKEQRVIYGAYSGVISAVIFVIIASILGYVPPESSKMILPIALFFFLMVGIIGGLIGNIVGKIGVLEKE